MRWTGALARAALALAAVALASALTRLLWPGGPPHPFLLFYAVVVGCTLAGGPIAGATATLASAFATAYLFLEPTPSLVIARTLDAVDLVVFVGCGFAITAALARESATQRAIATGRRNAEAAAADANRALAAKDEVLAVIAHDLKNPLQAIGLSAALLEAAEVPARRLHVERIRRASDRANRLVADLLDAAAIDAGTFRIDVRPCELPALVDEAIAAFEPLASVRGIALTAEPVPDVSLVCDPDRLEQALYNVIGNAVQYTEAHGHVFVAVAAPDAGGAVRVTVRDDGPGMTRDQIAHAFQRFWRGRKAPGGSGLGLFIAKGVIEAHGGRIDIASEPGRGTTVTLELPRTASHAPPHAGVAEHPALH